MLNFSLKSVPIIFTSNIDIVDYSRRCGYDNFLLFSEPEVPQALIGFSDDGIAVYEKRKLESMLLKYKMTLEELASKYKNEERAPIVIDIMDIE